MHTALTNGTIPYGTNGFIVVQKGGSAAVFKEGQATVAGWQGNRYNLSDPSRPKVRIRQHLRSDGRSYTTDPTGTLIFN